MIIKIILIILYLLVLYNFTFLEIVNIYLFNTKELDFILFILYFIISIWWLIFLRFFQIKDTSLKNNFKHTFKSILFLYIFLIVWFFISQDFLIQNRDTLTETKLSWNLAFLFLSFWLLVSPILTFIKDIKTRDFLTLFRKLLWILVFVIILRHVIDFFQSHYPTWEWIMDYYNYFIWILFESPVIWSGTIWTIMIILLWITSNKFSVRSLWSKFWKALHFLVFPIYLFSILHLWYLDRLDWFYIWFTVLIILARIISTIARRDRRKKAWKVTKYLCPPCWFIYDEKLWDIDWWLDPWTKFDDIPDDWYCPVCWAKKSDFVPYYETEDTIFWWTLLKVIKAKFITKDVLNLLLEWNRKIESSPGQYVWLVMKDFDWEFTRSYSIVSNDNNRVELYIKLKPTWRAWKLLKDTTVWDYFKITWIYGEFTLKETNNPKVFIATWTWLAPIINMINKNTFSKNNKIFFWVPRKEDLFWLDTLSKVESLEQNIFLSQEKVEWYNYWRINIENIKFQQNTEFYICWNPNMVESTEKFLKNKWYKNIFSEKFN